MNDLTTRLATLDDATAIAAIYNEGIADRIATFETEPRSPVQIAKQLVEKGDRFPTLVAECRATDPSTIAKQDEPEALPESVGRGLSLAALIGRSLNDVRRH